MRGEKAWSDGNASGMHREGPTQGWGGRARAERTQNMRYVFVTRDMSKRSAWLNAVASCRVERRACDAGKRYGAGGVRALGVAATQAACARGGTDSRLLGSGHARSAPGTCGSCP